MFLDKCKAYLKLEDGKTLEMGYASVSVTNQTVDFVNEFVPLLKMGTKVQIICTVKNHEKDIYLDSHCYSGEVYLSSQNLLRIVSVSDTIISGAERNLTVDTTMPADVCLAPGGKAMRPQVTSRPRTPAIRKWVEVVVYLISTTSIRFTCETQFEKGQRLYFQMKGLLKLEEVLLEVDEIMLFGSRLTGYRCKVISIEEPDKSNLAEFIRKANLVFSTEAILPPPGTLFREEASLPMPLT